jgi:type VI secretion system protein ImpE
MPAHLDFDNGGESLALIPTRYPGSESSGDGAIALARQTSWESIDAAAYRGLGQRILVTDAGETPMLEIRSISVHAEAMAAGETPGGASA